MLIAVTRPVSPSLANCQLTHLARQPIDIRLAERQHAEYERALQAAGCTLHRLEAAPDLPDAVFVEDLAIVLDEIAIVTRPGAPSRRPEAASVKAALAAWRPIAEMAAPATLDGGDVLRVGRRIFVGQSSRTNRAGLEQLRGIARPLGYEVEPLAVTGCLHLKSAVTAVGPDALLLDARCLAGAVFAGRGFDVIATAPGEEAAANALLAGDHLIYPSAFPRTAERLHARGFDPLLVDVSELAKAEGAVTCCSLIVPVP